MVDSVQSCRLRNLKHVLGVTNRLLQTWHLDCCPMHASTHFMHVKVALAGLNLCMLAFMSKGIWQEPDAYLQQMRGSQVSLTFAVSLYRM